ncbi:TPA: transposase, partial [Aeromonas veronii]|nr:transposase [Aeromonas veronii]
MVYTNSSRKGRANYSREFKQRLVEATNQPGVSVSKLAQEHGVNANLLFKWFKIDHGRKQPFGRVLLIWSVDLQLQTQPTHPSSDAAGPASQSC